MAPRAIVRTALARGLDLIAITDHNTAAMVSVLGDVARGAGLSFLCGLEMQTQEEVHLLAYFDALRACERFAAELYEALPFRRNDPAVWGDQVVVDADETILAYEEKCLLISARWSLEEAVSRIDRAGGLAVPAHVDRPAFGLLAQLGYSPEGIHFPLIEVVADAGPDDFPGAARFCNSDAHDLGAIGARRSIFVMRDATIEEIRRAAAGRGGRSVRCEHSEDAVRVRDRENGG